MAGGKCERILFRQFDHALIRPRPTHEHGTGSFTKGHTELDARNGLNHRLVNIFDGLDEVRLPQDKINLVRLVDPYCRELHLGRTFI